MKILVINAGSSSLKYQLFNMDDGSVIAKGLCEKIGIGGAVTHKRPGKENYSAEVELKSHDDAIELVLKLLTDAELGVISSVDEIGAVGHRVAHGGEKLRASSIINDAELEYLYSIVGINPLHGPPAIKGIEACRKIMKDKAQVGVFDTSFYSNMADYTYIYALPYEYYEKHGIRKYGFHGTSHRFVSAQAAEMLGKPIEELKIIVCHLGNGSSITAVKYGMAVDTSMGFTPQDGLPMGTRSGALDPTLITYLMKKENLTAEQIEDIINKKSGLLGVSGVSSDCREVMIAQENGCDRSRLALDILVNSIKKIVGSYIAEMNGLDAIAFTAGIGENDATIRERVCSDMEYLGIEIDKDINKNAPRGSKLDISKKSSKVKTLVIPTDEEYMIALDTLKLVTK